jgi:hypothetical protein
MEYNDYIDRLKQDLATPGKLSPAETVAVRGELVSALNAKGAQLNTGHQVQAAPAPSR